MKLRKPLVLSGISVDEIMFRDPTGGDIISCGFPITLDRRIDTDAISRYVERLGIIPADGERQAIEGLRAGTAASLSGRDFVQAQEEILSLFGNEYVSQAGNDAQNGSAS